MGSHTGVSTVSFGVEQVTSTSTTSPVTVRLYTTTSFPTGYPGSLTLLAATTINVSSANNLTVVTTPCSRLVPAGTSQLVMELENLGTHSRQHFLCRLECGGGNGSELY